MASPEDDLIGIPFPEHSSELLSSLNEQRQLGLLCDVTIKTQGLEYRTHRAVLAACSRYFKKLFAGPGPGQEVCELDFVGPEALGALLEFAYTATLTISSANMGEVLQAARLLEIPCVIAACVEILQGSGLEAPGPDAGDRERARRYLEAFATLPEGDAAAAAVLPSRPVARRSKKTRKFLQTRGARINNHAEELPPAATAAAEAGGSPPPPSPPPPPAPEGLPPAYEGYEAPEEEEELPPHAFPFPYQPSLSPEEAASDEDAIDPHLMAYLSSLHHESLAPGLDTPDKLVRKRRSQMPQECPVCHKERQAEDPHAQAHGRAALLLPALQRPLPAQLRPEEPHAPAHRRPALRVLPLPQGLRQGRPPPAAPQGPELPGGADAPPPPRRAAAAARRGAGARPVQRAARGAAPLPGPLLGPGAARRRGGGG
ncbi:zinc finger and BTB domain-containing protein 7B isoform X2 [Apteryx mantelli]|uniref:Zinc finger and BTB domain-containing protein 7B isoform X2 n=1 Tax=Apteryx mantelli TaxID=2696672 RepID=A0ABM4FWU3_9AVES